MARPLVALAASDPGLKASVRPSDQIPAGSHDGRSRSGGPNKRGSVWVPRSRLTGAT